MDNIKKNWFDLDTIGTKQRQAEEDLEDLHPKMDGRGSKNKRNTSQYFIKDTK